MKKLLFVLLAGTFVMASCGKKSPADAAAAKMCSCAGLKTLAEAQKEQAAAGADSTKMAAAAAKVMAAVAGAEACKAEGATLLKDVKPEDAAKVGAEFKAALEKQCPDIAKLN